MFDIFVPFAAGYLFARLLTVQRFKCERILTWNKECLGWRPLMPGDSVMPEKQYLACFEIDSETAERFQSLVE
jgi:hypothetical protein